MKTVYIITTAHVYDDVRVTHRVARSLIDNGISVSWFGPAPLNEPKLYYGIDYHFFYKENSKFSRLTAFLKLKTILNSVPAPDFYFAVDPDSMLIGNYLAKKNNCYSVFDIHEIFHKDMLFDHVPNYLVPLFGFLVMQFIKKNSAKANLVIGVGQTRLSPYKNVIKNSLIIRHCVPSSLVNGYKADPLKNGFSDVKIMQGKISKQQGTQQLLLAAKEASRLTRKSIKIMLFKIFSHDFPENEFSYFVEQNKLGDNLILYDPVPYFKIFELLSHCDIGAISYQKRMGIGCMPNRIFEYMAVGLPALVPSYSIEMHSIIQKYHCGIESDMENVDDISAKIINLISDPEASKMLGMNGYNAFKQECNWESESRKLIEWIKKERNESSI